MIVRLHIVGMTAGAARSRRLASALVCFSLGVTTFTGHVQAQDQDRAEPARPATICMALPLTDGSAMNIILPASNEPAMRAEGYVVVSCGEAFTDRASQERWRDNICQITSSWREHLQRHFERERGARPATLCGMAEAVLGPWDRRGRN